MIKQSLAWWTFVSNSFPPEQFIKAAAEIGYDGIEMAPQEYWSVIKEHGLEIVNQGGHRRIPEGLNRLEHLSMIQEELEQSLVLAKRWGLKNLICFSGDAQGLSDAEGLDNAVNNLKALAPLAEDAAITLIFEPLNTKVDHPDYHASTMAWGLELVERVDSPNVKLLFDVYHRQIMEGDIISCIQEHHEWFAHYHTAGHPGRHDLDEYQEINYPAVFRAIKATGYSGYIGHEFTPKGDTRDALQAVFKLTQDSLKVSL